MARIFRMKAGLEIGLALSTKEADALREHLCDSYSIRTGAVSVKRALMNQHAKEKMTERVETAKTLLRKAGFTVTPSMKPTATLIREGHCPTCGTTSLVYNLKRFRGSRFFQEGHCQVCGQWFTEESTVTYNTTTLGVKGE